MSSINPGGSRIHSRANSSTTVPILRPRNKRLVTDLQDLTDEQTKQNTFTPNHISSSVFTLDSPYVSRASSPIPREHLSRSSSTNPARNSNGPVYGETLTAAYGAELSKSLSGLWSKSWTSLQGMASNALGSDAPAEMIKDKSPQRIRRPFEATHPLGKDAQWGPSTNQPQPGIGTREERKAIVSARKREDMLKSAGDYSYTDLAPHAKRRTSDDFESVSTPPGETDDRETLVYIHRVRPEDTLAGIAIRFNCQLAVLKKTNRMWSNDGVQARRTILLPVNACTVKGKRVSSPRSERPMLLEGDLLCGNGSSERVGDRDIASTQDASARPANGSSRPGAGIRKVSFSTSRASASTWVPPSPSASSTKTTSGLAAEEGWIHDSWIQLETSPVPVEIARMPRQDLAFFPRPRRKSPSFSDNDTPSASFDLARPGPAFSDLGSSPGTAQPLVKSRRSSSTHHPLPKHLTGPGGVGSLVGKGPIVMGPSEDKLTKVLAKNFPSLLPTTRNPADDDDAVLAAALSPGGSTAGLESMSGAIEGWVRKLAHNAAKMVEPMPGTTGGRRVPKGALGLEQERGGGDLIELNDAFEIGGDEEDSTEEAQRGRVRPNIIIGSGRVEAVVASPGPTREKAYFGLREDDSKGEKKTKGE